MPVVDRYPRHSQPSFLASESPRDMSQHYNKPSYYASNNMNVAPPTSGVAMGGMGNHVYPHQTTADAYRYPNVHQQPPHPQRSQQEYVKPANPPLKMLVPSEMVGAIIGRGGANIREITKASRARVDVHRNYETEVSAGQQQQQQQQPHPPNGILPALSSHAASSEKVISIYGKEGESISTACKKILEVMDTEFKKIRQNRMECGVPGVPGFMNGMTMTMTGKPAAALTMMPETALKILAPNALIGRIIGKQGKKVNEIKDKSGAKITVSNVYDINAENPERTIIITGNLDAMVAAESKISEILRICHQQELNKFPPQGTEGGGYYSPSRYRESNNNNNNSIDHNSSPYSNYLARGGGGFHQGGRGGAGGGGGGGGGGGQSHLVGQPAMMGAGLVDVSPSSMNHNNGPPMLPHHHTQLPPPQFGGPPPMNQENYPGQQANACFPDPNFDTVFLYVPAASVGAIIGKKGESVRQITRSSGAIIKIAAENKEKAEEGVVKTAGVGFDQPVPPRDASKTPGEKSVAITATFDAQCRAIAQIFKKLFEERFFGNDPPFLALDLLIPSSQMGKVLGKQKLKIRTIERRTGVNIRVPENKAAMVPSAEEEEEDVEEEAASEKENTAKMSKAAAEHDDSMSYVTIRGSLTQMIQAMTMVKEILHGELPLGGAGFMGPPVPPHMYPPFHHRNPFSYPNYRGSRGRARF